VFASGEKNASQSYSLEEDPAWDEGKDVFVLSETGLGKDSLFAFAPQLEQ
jgi:hypothetical protein